jgi:autotransporter-associated beta strand protein
MFAFSRHPQAKTLSSASRGARVLLALVSFASAASAQITFNESFTGTTAPGWVFGGTGGYVPELTAPSIDSAGNGWLRLTDNGGNRSTYALLDTQIFSVGAQLQVTLDYTFWNGTGGGADGITFFLIDGNVNAGSFAAGANGGSLGYAQKTGIPGMVGGYLGFGFDNFGNFSNPTEGRVGGTGFVPNAIAVRGPESSQWGFVAGSGPLASGMDFPDARTRPLQTGDDYRSFRLTLDASNLLTVEMKFGASSNFITAFTTDLSAYDRPETLKIGFTGSTGGSTEIHEIRNVAVTTSAFTANNVEWDNGGSADKAWSTGTNWVGDAAPAANADLLFRNASPATAQTATQNGNFTVRSLNFDSTRNYTLNGNGTLTLGDGIAGNGPSINVTQSGNTTSRHEVQNALTLAEATRVINTGNSLLVLSGNYTTAGSTSNIGGNGSIVFDGPISGSGAFVKNDSGYLTLSANNAAWTGPLTVNGGVVALTNNNALGTTGAGATTTVLSGGSLFLRDGTAAAPRTLAEPLTLSGNGIRFRDDTNSGALHADGGVNTVTSAITLSGNTGIGARNDALLTLSGVISGASSLTKLGAGTLVLNAANTYTGATIINEGELRLTNAAALSASTNVRLSGGVLELGAGNYTAALGTGAGQVQFTSSGGFSAFGADRTVNLGGANATLTWNSTPAFLGNGQALLLSSDVANATVTLTNPIALNGGQREFRVGNGSAALDATLSGNLTGTGTSGLVKTGTGTLNLTGTNTFNGTTELRAGALRGNLSANSNLQLNGGVLEVTAATAPTVLGAGAGQVQWTGSGGFAASGAPRTVSLNSGAPLTWGGNASFIGANSTLVLGSVSADNNLTFANALNLGTSGNRTISTVRGTGATASGTLSGIVSGSANLAVTGNGRLDLTAANTNNGSVTITGSEVRLNGAAGTMLSASGFTMEKGGSLYLDSSTGLNADRIGATTPVTLNGGTLAHRGNNNNNTREGLGALTLSGGSNTVDILNSGTRDARLTFTSLAARNVGATLDILRPNATSDLRFTTSPTLDDGILAYATVNGADFATHTGNNRDIAAYTAYDTGAETAWTVTTINAAPADVTLTTARTLNSLKLGAGIDVAQAGFDLTLQSGGLLTTGATAATISGGNLTTGNANELIIHAYNTVGTTISSNLTGTGGLTKSGTGNLTLSGTTANTLTGNTTVNDGTLVLAKSNGVTALAGNVTIGDGRGIDILRLDANEQIADSATVTLRGGPLGDSANVARLELNGTTATTTQDSRIESFGKLDVTGNSVLDFGGGDAGSPTYLYLDFLSVAADSQLTVANWMEFTDFILVKTANFDANQLPRVTFNGFNGTASFKAYDAIYTQITPIPEPATFAGITGILVVAGVLSRRRRSQRSR